MAEKSYRVEITVAIIALIGVVTGAMFNNRDKLFRSAGPTISAVAPPTGLVSMPSAESFSQQRPQLLSPSDRSIFDHYREIWTSYGWQYPTPSVTAWMWNFKPVTRRTIPLNGYVTNYPRQHRRPIAHRSNFKRYLGTLACHCDQQCGAGKPAV